MTNAKIQKMLDEMFESCEDNDVMREALQEIAAKYGFGDDEEEEETE